MKLKNHIDWITNKFDICLTKTQSLSKNPLYVCKRLFDIQINNGIYQLSSLAVTVERPISHRVLFLSIVVHRRRWWGRAQRSWSVWDQWLHGRRSLRSRSANKLQKSTSLGILVALQETDNRSRNFRDGPVLCRKPSISAIPAIPRPLERELS